MASIAPTCTSSSAATPMLTVSATAFAAGTSIGAGDRRVERAAAEEHGELFAADAREHVFRTERGEDSMRTLPENRVTRAMAVRVVHLFEVVEVDHEDAQPCG